ncbi:MAG: NAD(P)/FAD-dependent oxidoreductase [Campylobacterota bacterium]|nr:NAD(P)/FAD-dependent oxidoreductase [Campylobacterota bacterium]
MDKNRSHLSKNIAIIGGGAAGLMSAITAAASGHSVTIFEKSDRIGKKILASGNGRCNISNTSLHVKNYFSQNPNFVNHALHQFDFKHFKKFCSALGLFLDIKDDGRVYPLSNEAKTVQMLLEEQAKALHVRILCHQHVTVIEKKETLFSLTCKDKQAPYQNFDALILTTGSEAALQLGGSDEGYQLAKNFGHEIEPTYPSLVQLCLDSNIHAKMAGVKCSGSVTLYIDREKRETISGDLLFTKYGISGFAILDISQGASLALMNYQHVAISLNLLAQFTLQELQAQLSQLRNRLQDRSIEHLLVGLISSKIVPHLLFTCKINPKTLCAHISTKDLKKILFTLTQWRFDVSDTHGFAHAEVSGGGISTDKVNPKTMQSQLVEGLYFAGEVLDVVGERGGYNLHFAWASGYLAAKNL